MQRSVVSVPEAVFARSCELQKDQGGSRHVLQGVFRKEKNLFQFRISCRHACFFTTCFPP